MNRYSIAVRIAVPDATRQFDACAGGEDGPNDSFAPGVVAHNALHFDAGYPSAWNIGQVSPVLVESLAGQWREPVVALDRHRFRLWDGTGRRRRRALRDDLADDLVGVLTEVIDLDDAIVAGDQPTRARLWSLRERHSEAINAAGVPHKFDVTLPLSRLAEFDRRVRREVSAIVASARTVLWGHLGDGNLHVNVLGLSPEDSVVDDAVLRLVVELGGSISAEHGIGVAKTRWLSLDRHGTDLQAMHSIKRALDPHGILNPGCC